MAIREPLKQEEQLVAGIGGVGILLFIVGGSLIGFSSTDSETATMFIYVGLAGIATAIVLWMVLLRPWLSFDDLQTPYYTGHHHDDHHHNHHDTHSEIPTEHDVHEALVIEASEATPHLEIVFDTPSASPTEAKPLKIDVATVETAETIAEEFVQEAPPSVSTAEAAEPTEALTPITSVEQEHNDLKHIKGIGAAVEKALHASGITSYAQIAQMTPQDLEHIVKVEHKVRLIGGTNSWPRQAQFLLDGDLEGLKVFQASL